MHRTFGAASGETNPTSTAQHWPVREKILDLTGEATPPPHREKQGPRSARVLGPHDKRHRASLYLIIGHAVGLQTMAKPK